MYRQIALPCFNLQLPIDALLKLPITWNINCHERARDCFKDPPINLADIFDRLQSAGNVIMVGSYIQCLLNPDNVGKAPKDIDIQVQCESLPTDTQIIGALFKFDLPEPPSLPVIGTPATPIRASSALSNPVKPFKTASSFISKPLQLTVLRDPKKLTAFGFSVCLNGCIADQHTISVDICIIQIQKDVPIFDFFHHSIGWSYQEESMIPLVPQSSEAAKLEWVERAKKLEQSKILESVKGSGSLIRSFWNRFAKHIALGYSAPLIEWQEAITSIKSTYLRNGATSNILEKLEKLPPELHYPYCLTLRILGEWGNLPQHICPIPIPDDQIQKQAQSIIHNQIAHDTFDDVPSLKKTLKGNRALWTPIVWAWMKKNWKMVESQDWILHCWENKIPTDWRTFTPDLFPILNELAKHALKNGAIHHELWGMIQPHIKTIHSKYSKELKDSTHFKEWLSQYENKEALETSEKDPPIDTLCRSIGSEGFNVDPMIVTQIGISNIPDSILKDLLKKLKVLMLSGNQKKKKTIASADIENAHTIYAMLLNESDTLNQYKLELSGIAKAMYPMYLHHREPSDLLSKVRKSYTDGAWVQFLLLPVDDTDLYTQFSRTLTAETFCKDPFISSSMLPILEQELCKQHRSTLAYLMKQHRIVDVSLFCQALPVNYAIEGFTIAIHQASYHLASVFLKRCPAEFQETIRHHDVLGIRYQLKELIAKDKSLDDIVESCSLNKAQQILSECQTLIVGCFNNTQEFNTFDTSKLLTDTPELLLIPFKTQYGKICLLDSVDTFKIKSSDGDTTSVITWISDLLIKNYGVIRDLVFRGKVNLTGIISTMILNPDTKYSLMMLEILRDCYSHNPERLCEDLLNGRNISILLKKTDLLTDPSIQLVQKRWEFIQLKFQEYQKKDHRDVSELPIRLNERSATVPPQISDLELQQFVMGSYSIYYSLYCMKSNTKQIQRFIQIAGDYPIPLHACHSQLLKILVSRMVYKALIQTSFDVFYANVFPEIQKILMKYSKLDGDGPISIKLCDCIDQLTQLFKRYGVDEPYDTVDWRHLITPSIQPELVIESIILESSPLVISVNFVEGVLDKIIMKANISDE